jgi:hypothetical protein
MIDEREDYWRKSSCSDPSIVLGVAKSTKHFSQTTKNLSQCSRHLDQDMKPTLLDWNYRSLLSCEGHVVAQAASHTSVVQVRVRARTYEICDGQSGFGAGFLRELRFLLPIIPPTAPRSSSSSRTGTIAQKWPLCRVDSLTPSQEIKKRTSTVIRNRSVKFSVVR